MAASSRQVKIDGVDYVLADLSEASRTQLMNIQAVDGEIARLQQQLAFARTARSVYVALLRDSLKEAEAAEDKKEDKKEVLPAEASGKKKSARKPAGSDV